MLDPHIPRAVRRRLIVAAVSAIPLLVLLQIAEAERAKPPACQECRHAD